MASRVDIEKVAFTGSTLVGCKVMETIAKSNLKNITIERAAVRGPAVQQPVYSLAWDELSCSYLTSYMYYIMYEALQGIFVQDDNILISSAVL
ncbi:hypothetical protein BDZ89DRAFT_1133336 [Hymenopellis radicata]|nr:hypothetical protein BDZ89DRAFT_1133336 [Hymenopellis radicata]